MRRHAASAKFDKAFIVVIFWFKFCFELSSHNLSQRYKQYRTIVPIKTKIFHEWSFFIDEWTFYSEERRFLKKYVEPRYCETPQYHKVIIPILVVYTKHTLKVLRPLTLRTHHLLHDVAHGAVTAIEL